MADTTVICECGESLPTSNQFPVCCGAYIIYDFGHCGDHECDNLTPKVLLAYLENMNRCYSYRGSILMAILNEQQNDEFSTTFRKAGFKVAQKSKSSGLFLYTKEAKVEKERR